MKTVPLYGGVAAGRVALVDDADYELVMQHRWNVYERRRGGKVHGPYAFTSVRREDGRRRMLLMHILILGAKGIDHANHNGLDNRRSNLRLATPVENMGNQRHMPGGTSQYKGVYWDKLQRRWVARLGVNGKYLWLGGFSSEVEAARAYDAAAREQFGGFAYLNFPDREVPDTTCLTEAGIMLDGSAEKAPRQPSNAAWWANRAPETRVCQVCGSKYLARATRRSFYCSDKCKQRAYQARKKAAAA